MDIYKYKDIYLFYNTKLCKDNQSYNLESMYDKPSV